MRCSLSHILIQFWWLPLWLNPSYPSIPIARVYLKLENLLSHPTKFIPRDHRKDSSSEEVMRSFQIILLTSARLLSIFLLLMSRFNCRFLSAFSPLLNCTKPSVKSFQAIDSPKVISIARVLFEEVVTYQTFSKTISEGNVFLLSDWPLQNSTSITEPYVLMSKNFRIQVDCLDITWRRCIRS